MSFIIRPATLAELDIMVEWAAKEGWNPGLHDADAFYATDPEGFLLGLLDNQPIAAISAVAYDNSFGFIGFYIVKSEYRSSGYGIQMWNEAIKHLSTQNIGLDGVLAQQENYKKSGFKLAYRNIRYEGTGTNNKVDNSHVVPLSEVPFEQLLQYDRHIFPTERAAFLKAWITQPESLAIAYQTEKQLQGYGMVRKCRTGFKVGPLFADNSEIANTLFEHMQSFVGENEQLFLDTPEVNKAAIVLAEKHGMKPMFETARMYTKTEPKVAVEKIYGVTTFELG